MFKNTLLPRSAYLLVTHGSRDPRPRIALTQLAYLVRQQLETLDRCYVQTQDTDRDNEARATAILQDLHTPAQKTRFLPVSNLKRGNLLQKTGFCPRRKQSPLQTSLPYSSLVNTASLELDSLPLHQTIQQWGEEVLAFGIKKLRILPLFLLPGVHVKEDIPREVRLAEQALGGKIRLELSPYLGSNPNLRQLLAWQFSHFPREGRILLSHGSRRRSGNQPIEAIATHFKALPAYWSVSPSLREQVELLIKQGNLSVAIVPYFLFAGGITDAIAQQVQQLRSDFPEIRFLLGEPLGATPELANLIINGVWKEKLTNPV